MELFDTASSKHLPSVSVVVPVYNGAQTIAACIESLLKQDYPADRFDIIVVENGSTDNTSEVVKRYPVRLFHSFDQGPAPARNMGVSLSCADIIAFTDADCVAAPNWLSELIKPYADPQIGGSGGPIQAHEHVQRTLVEVFSDQHSPLVNFEKGREFFMPDLYTANASYRRTLLNQVGGFDVRLVTGEDVDLAWRIQLGTGCKLAFAADAVIYHHHRATVKGLARQYRQYGFGEVLLNVMYRDKPGFRRSPLNTYSRIFGQALALPRYAASLVLRSARRAVGRETDYGVLEPRLCMLVEFSNIVGKLEAIKATRMMRTATPILNTKPEVLVRRLFPEKKL